MNGYFNWDDESASSIGGYPIAPDWWSRKYEYPWAIKYAKSGMIVADMGCGWMDRPFKDALAGICKKVYAVDGDDRIFMLKQYPNVEYVVGNFTQALPIPEASLDRIFCISVLEEDAGKIGDALKEFARLLKPDGKVIITMDVQYDFAKPIGKYPGVNLLDFFKGVKDAGLIMVGGMDIDKTNAVFNESFNLCCFHCVLERRV